MERILEIEKRNFNICFQMFRNIVEDYPNMYWNEKVGGFVSWQQFIHVFSGISYWMKSRETECTNPFEGKQIFSELESEPIDHINKEEIVDYMEKTSVQVLGYFEKRTDDWLIEKSIVDEKYTHLDIINMQIRHIQYHLGYFESFLRERGLKTQVWID